MGKYLYSFNEYSKNEKLDLSDVSDSEKLTIKKATKRFNENRHIDWSIYDDYVYSEGDGLYLDEDELRNGRVVTTNRKTPFINIKHPLGEHTMNRSMNDSLSKERSMIRKVVYGEEPERCSGCGEYKPSVSRNHDDMETIPLCKSCYNED